MAGYEKVAGLMTKHSEVATFQRFDFLNTLNILYLQAELVHLEKDLRESMKEDLESGDNIDSERPSEAGSLAEIEGDEDISSVRGRRNQTTEAEMEKGSLSQHVSSSDCSGMRINERVESGRNWYFLANMENCATWNIMLKTRERLNEYSQTSLLQMCIETTLKKFRCCDTTISGYENSALTECVRPGISPAMC